MPLTPEQSELVLRYAPTMNIRMLAEKIGVSYDVMYIHVNKYRIQTATVRKDQKLNAGKKRIRSLPIKEGCFNVNERPNWMI